MYYLDPMTLKVSRYVCRQWYEVATPLLFQRVTLCRPESSHSLQQILDHTEISSLVKVLSFESPNDRGQRDIALLPLLASPAMMRILPLAMTCHIRQHQQTTFIATLACLNRDVNPFPAPLLNEIRIITSDIPYFGTSLFGSLREIHINAESVQLPPSFTLRSIEEISITCKQAGQELLIDFINRHKTLRKFHLTLLIAFGPLSLALQNIIKDALQTRVSEEDATSIVNGATENAQGESSVFLRSICREMIAKLDKTLVKALRGDLATLFRLLEIEAQEKHRRTQEEMRSVLDNRETIEMSVSGEYIAGEVPEFEA